MFALKHLRALTTGLSGKTNVFIPNTNDFLANTFQKVVVYAPGIQATVERRANDSLVITELWLDPGESYLAIERGSREKPGVYEVSRGPQGVKIKYKNNGRITVRDARRVVVADTRYPMPKTAAEQASHNLGDMFGTDVAQVGDFDLFFSPVGSRLGGMRSYNPLVLNQGYAFAGLLADAIEQSIKQRGVVWASELGGSVVLTQALHALAHKKLSFKLQNHIVKMYLPPTDPRPTLAAAKHLGMLVDRNIAQGNGNVRAVFNSFVVNAGRAKDKSDYYSRQYYAGDLVNNGAAAFGAIGAVSFATGLVMSSTVIAAAGSVASAAGAIQLTCKAIKKRLKEGV